MANPLTSNSVPIFRALLLVSGVLVESAIVRLYTLPFANLRRGSLVVGAKSPFHSLTQILVNKRRKLVLRPVTDN